ncbi:MAG: glycoside hydrolase family 43 protein [bacterium]|jgi:hypothetical protein|nr:glycoside hydrolase family 43 protein [bacterium]
MKWISMITLAGLLSLLPLGGQTEGGAAYLFTSFRDNGQDGLHLAYSKDGLHWTALKNDLPFLAPLVGGDKLMRDPCLILGPDNVFHMVWTVSWKEKSVGIAHSKDLIHWSEQKAIPVMAHEATVRNTWAPEIFYDDVKQQYLIFWASTIPGRFPETETTGDDQLNHRIYCTTTKDFETYTPTALFYDPGFNVIDSTIVKKADGEYVMFLKDETRTPPQKNIKIAYAAKPTGPWGPASEPITGDYWAEGPTAIQIAGEWIVYFDKYTLHKYGALRSKDLKTWEEVSDQLVYPKGMRHGSVLQVPQSVLDGLLALE